MWKDWLSFSKNERYGIVTLFVLVCIVAFLPYFYQVFFFETESISTQNDFEKVDSFFQSLKQKPKITKPKFSIMEEEKPINEKVELFSFDPNTVSVSELVSLGFSVRQAQVIESYRNRGGVFREPSDFAKMYVVDSDKFKTLIPYISIDTLAFTEQKSPEKEFESKAPVIVELNSADTLELVQLKGIGKSYARRIVAYRQLLGGFTRVEQLTEIWGFSPELLGSIRQNITLDTTVVQQINLNLVTFQDLRKHPYLTEYQARAIIYYRETKGNIGNVNEIAKNKLVDPDTFRKLKMYLTVN